MRWNRLWILLMGLAASAGAGEVTVVDCDDPAAFTVSANCSVSAASEHKEGTGAVSVSFDSVGLNDSSPYARVYCSPKDWTGYDGIRFWVRSTTGATAGTIQVLWGRFYATFPITSSWTEVTIPWSEFYQRLYQGPIEDALDSIDAVEFTLNPTVTHDQLDRAARSYEVDDIRIVDGLTAEVTPVPSVVGLPVSASRVSGGAPLKIVALGTSITYGHLNGGGRLAVPWPARLEEMLKAGLGKSDITVLNYGIGGAKSWQGGCNLYEFVVDEAPDMVIIEYLGNDYWDAEDYGGGNGMANFRLNMEHLMDKLLRWGQADVVIVLHNPYGEAGNTHLYDAYMAELEAAADARNLLVADVYSYFLAMDESAMLSYYQAGDTAHLTQEGSDVMAQVIYDAVYPYLSSSDGEAPSVGAAAVVLKGSAADAVSPQVRLRVDGVVEGWVSGPWVSREIAVDLSQAGKSIVVEAEDASGNTGSVTVSVSLR